MSIKLGSNIASLQAQRRLGDTSSALSKVFERLSSGQRINKASDDVAGLSITESLKVDERIFRQGIRNLNDGISLLNIADSALESLGAIVGRLQELSAQSANSTFGKSQRESIDQEAQALSKEYTRILQTTKFNGISLFNGSLPEGISLQAGGSPLTATLGGAVGTGEFLTGNQTSSGFFPYDAKSGDFNNDGFIDIVSANLASNSLSIMLGNGDGTFRSQVTYQTGTEPYGVTISDFNNDGNLDLANTDYISGSISVFLGNGNGTFQARTSYATGVNPFSVHAADLDGDGAVDLISADPGSARLSIFFGNGDGTFQSRESSVLGGSVRFVNSGDLDGDGDLDLVTNDQTTGTLRVHLGNGDGTFQTYTSYAVGSAAASIAIADLNGDGALDIATADTSGNAMSVLLGNGNGTFRARVSYATGAAPERTGVADLNGDGIMDLVGSHPGGGGFISILIGNGNGTYQAARSQATGVTPLSINFADFNQDGVLDFLTAGGNSASVSVLLGDSVQGSSPLIPFDLLTVASARQAMSIFDAKRRELSTQRGQIGASESRITIAISDLAVKAENFAAAASRITNADIAEEAANLTRLRILQEAATAILAQANQQPQIVLQLINGFD